MEEITIKEKSFELFPEMQTDSDDWDVIEEQCDRDAQRKAFVKGANYVLDILEKDLPLEDNRNLNDYGKALVCRMKECIEQLKK